MDSPTSKRSTNESSSRSTGGSNSYEHYSALAAQIRGNILKMSHRAHSSHVGGSLSIADILAVLYGYHGVNWNLLQQVEKSEQLKTLLYVIAERTAAVPYPQQH